MNSHIPNKTNLLMKDFALVGLALKQRRKVTRKPQLLSPSTLIIRNNSLNLSSEYVEITVCLVYFVLFSKNVSQPRSLT